MFVLSKTTFLIYFQEINQTTESILHIFIQIQKNINFYKKNKSFSKNYFSKTIFNKTKPKCQNQDNFTEKKLHISYIKKEINLLQKKK